MSPNKWSRPTHNAEHRTEAELSNRAKDDRKSTRLKKRHRRDLSPDEVGRIVQATKQPYKLKKTVADEHRITPHLVSALVKEAIKKPEK